MNNDSTIKNIKDMITFGINRTAILYNQELISDPIKYDLQYQQDHLYFQERRSKDPAFFRYIFAESHKSSNFESKRRFILKAVLRDLCIGEFNTSQLSGVVDLESDKFPKSFHSKNKEGDYNPRHSRRMLNEELNELVVKKGHGDDDERNRNYTTAFSIKHDKIDPSLDQGKKMWENELKNNSENIDDILSISITASLMQIFPEKWEDIMHLRDIMLNTLWSFGGDILSGPNYLALESEITSISPHFIMLYEHINAISEISWFMRKDNGKRISILAVKPQLIVNVSDIEKTVEILRNSRMENFQVIHLLMPATNSLMHYGFSDVAILLMNKLIALNDEVELTGEMALQFSAILRESGKYSDMLTFTENSSKNLNSQQDTFVLALFKIRHAEALAFNGRHNDAIIILNEMFSKRDQFTGEYIAYNKLIKNASDYVLTENEKALENNSTPIRVSLLLNLIKASLRIKEYCLTEKYIEEFFNTEKEFLKKETSTGILLKLNEIYVDVIRKCNSI